MGNQNGTSKLKDMVDYVKNEAKKTKQTHIRNWLKMVQNFIMIFEKCSILAHEIQ